MKKEIKQALKPKENKKKKNVKTYTDNPLLKTKKKETELKGVTYTPRLNKNSMNMVKGKKSFLERQASFEKKKQAKAQKLLEEKKKKEDEILKKSRNTKTQNKDINNLLTQPVLDLET